MTLPSGDGGGLKRFLTIDGAREAMEGGSRLLSTDTKVVESGLNEIEGDIEDEDSDFGKVMRCLKICIQAYQIMGTFSVRFFNVQYPDLYLRLCSIAVVFTSFDLALLFPFSRECLVTERKDLFFVSLVAYTIAPVGFTLLCFLLYGYIRNASASAERAFLKDWGSLRELIQGPPKGPEKGTPPTVVLHGLLPREQFGAKRNGAVGQIRKRLADGRYTVELIEIDGENAEEEDEDDDDTTAGDAGGGKGATKSATNDDTKEATTEISTAEHAGGDATGKKEEPKYVDVSAYQIYRKKHFDEMKAYFDTLCFTLLFFSYLIFTAVSTKVLDFFGQEYIYVHDRYPDGETVEGVGVLPEECKGDPYDGIQFGVSGDFPTTEACQQEVVMCVLRADYSTRCDSNLYK